MSNVLMNLQYKTISVNVKLLEHLSVFLHASIVLNILYCDSRLVQKFLA